MRLFWFCLALSLLAAFAEDASAGPLRRLFGRFRLAGGGSCATSAAQGSAFRQCSDGSCSR